MAKNTNRKKRNPNGKTREQIAGEALHNAITNESTMNYETIIEGFMEMGIPAEEITPRENVFTFNAWKALGRVVKKGEHGVQVLTFIQCEKKPEKEGDDPIRYKRQKTTTVFHISQTVRLDGQPDPIEEEDATEEECEQ